MHKESQIVRLASGHDDQPREDNKDAIEEIPTNPKLKNTSTMYLWSLGITMGSFVFGYSLVLITILGSSIQHAMPVNSKQDITMYLSLCTTALPVGALAGSLLYLRILKVLRSENKAMMLCDYCLISLYLLQSITLQPIAITVLRFLIGFCIGVSGTIIPMYLKSISPIEISGKIGSFNQILITIGIAAAYAMGFVIDGEDLGNQWRWRLCVIVPCLACCMRIITCQKFRYETIERHIQKNDYEILLTYVKQFYEASTFSVHELIKSKKCETKNEGSQGANSPGGYRNRILLSLVLMVMNQFCGINAIIFYANQLFASISQGDSQYAVLMSFYMGIFQIVVTILSGSLLDKFGRRSLMLFGETIIIIALLGAYYMLDSGWDPKYASYAIFAHIAGFSLSLGPITVVYLSQILDDISQFMVMLWIQTVLISFSSNLLIDSFGIGKTFLLFAGVSIACFLYVIPTMLETKGKTRKQIYEQFVKSS